MNMKAFWPSLFILLGGISCVATIPMIPQRPAPIVRVALVKDARELLVQTGRDYEVLDPVLGDVLMQGRRLPSTKIYAVGQKIVFGANRFPLARLRIRSSRDITLRLKDQERRFRGAVDVIRNDDNTLLVINRIDVENYIRGVLYHEVSPRWPLEAIKAQAVAARTYALYQKKANVGRPYDLTNDIYSQVYGGRTSEKYRTNLAVERTMGEVLVYHGDLLPAYFHATCGGHTENVTQLWKHKDIPPLRGVPCRFCTHSPHFFWEKHLSLQDVRKKLNQQGFPMGAIKDIVVRDRNASGRIKDLQITARDGKRLIISGKDFRNAVGPNIVRSNNYRISCDGKEAFLSGKGWGHGVGLCQWGAQKMASQGVGYRAILEYYYPGAVVVGQWADQP